MVFVVAFDVSAGYVFPEYFPKSCDFLIVLQTVQTQKKQSISFVLFRKFLLDNGHKYLQVAVVPESANAH